MIAALGAFDGFHRGHARLFELAGEAAASRGLGWGAVTFDPSPELFMGTIKKILFTQRERELIRLFLGIPELIVLKFDDVLSRFSPERFWEFLRGQVNLDGVVVGRDFRFGHRRAGDADLLERYCREAGLFFLAADLLRSGDAMGRGHVPLLKISSSDIRIEAESGECEAAAEELGYPYFILTKVNHGLERGRKLGFPTANLEIPDAKLMPADGVYAAAVLVKGTWRAGALSIGTNPTFGDVPDVRAEVFVLDYEGDLYGEDLLVFFLSRLRPQVRFENTSRLVRQIEDDVERSKAAFGHALNASPEVYRKFATGYQAVALSFKVLSIRNSVP